jgi:AcrR family transcriptional regulator
MLISIRDSCYHAGMTATQPPSESRTRYHHGDLRAAMIRAAEQLITELGPEAVSVREVARRAGVSSGAPFHHFPTRQALMTAVAEEATHQLRQRVEAAVAGIPETKPARRMRAIARAWLRWVVDNPAQFKVVSDRRLIDFAEPIQRDNAAIQSLMRHALRHAIRSNGKRAIDIDLAMLEMRAMAYGLARMLVDGHLPQWGVSEADTSRRMEAALDDLLARLMGKKAG